MDKYKKEIYDFLVNKAVESYYTYDTLEMFYKQKYINYKGFTIRYVRVYIGGRECLSIEYIQDENDDDSYINTFTFEEDVKKKIRINNINILLDI